MEDSLFYVDTPYGDLYFVKGEPTIWDAGKWPLYVFTLATPGSKYIKQVVESQKIRGYHLVQCVPKKNSNLYDSVLN